MDASVIVAVLASETEEAVIRDALAEVKTLATSPIAIFEASSRLSRIFNVPLEQAHAAVLVFLECLPARILDITAAVSAIAHACAARYHHLTGHPARLNLGDCFAYASARSAGLRLAYKGNYFSRTDIDGVRFGP